MELLKANTIYREILDSEIFYFSEDNNYTDEDVQAYENDYDNYIYHISLKDSIKGELDLSIEGIVDLIMKEGSNYLYTIITHDTVVMCNKLITIETHRENYYVGIASGNYKPDALFDSMIVSHGLATNFTNNALPTVDNVLKNANKIFDNNSIEISCSYKTQCMGPVGLYITGECEVASNIDLDTIVKEDGNRYISSTQTAVYDSNTNEKINITLHNINNDGDNYVLENVIYTKDQIDLSKWEHMELVYKNVDIKGVWIKKWALKNKRALEAAKEIAYMCNVKLYYINEKIRNTSPPLVDDGIIDLTDDEIIKI